MEGLLLKENWLKPMQKARIGMTVILIDAEHRTYLPVGESLGILYYLLLMQECRWK
jgi:hypothetical protein